MNAQTHKLPTGWQKTNLGSIGVTLSGLTGKTKADFGHGKPYIPYMNVFQNSHIDKNFLNFVEIKEGERQNRLEYGDYIFTTSSETPDEVGMSTVVNDDLGEVYLNSFCFIFRPQKKILDPDFGGYLFRGPDFRKKIGTHAKGSTRFNLSKKDFLGVEIAFPESRKEQVKIVEILRTLDTQILTTDLIITNLRKLKTAVVQDVFRKGLGHARFKKTQLGELPNTWEVSTIETVCETSSGGTPLRSKHEYFQGGNIPWITSGEVKGGRIKNSAQFITEVGLQNSSAKLFPVDTVLIAMYGATAGQVGILKLEATTNQAICGILPSTKFVPEFLYQYFAYRSKELKALAGGGAQPNISQKIIRDQYVPIPPITEQKQIADLLAVIDGRISINIETKKTLTTLKKGLMRDLLSGAKKVNI